MKKSKATEAYRVASEIVAIRAALKERGYHIHKQPKQAAWMRHMVGAQGLAPLRWFKGQFA